MSLATTGERPNGINADCFAPAAKVSIELSTTAEFPRRGRPAASRALKSDQYLSRRRSSQLFLSLRPAFPRAGGVIPNPNRAFDPAIESNQRNEPIGIMGTDLQNAYFMNTRGKAATL
jgi:hypothetical protein